MLDRRVNNEQKNLTIEIKLLITGIAAPSNADQQFK